jgi:hypothetical protein
MTEPSRPALAAICLIGADRARWMMSMPARSSPFSVLAELVEDLAGAEHGDAAAGEDALLDRRTAGVEGVLDAGLLLLHLDLGGGADVDLGDAAGELGEALLELLAVVVAEWSLDLGGGSARCGP